MNSATGWGGTYDGIATAPCTTCGTNLPQLGILLSGTNVLVGWSTSYSGFTLQSTTNLSPPVAWATVSPAPSIVGSYYAVTNPIAGTKKFYRLSQ